MALKNAVDKTVSYEVAMVTVGYIFCKHCNGTGKSGSKVQHNRYTTSNCPVCGGKGKTAVKHTTVVSLSEALTNLGVKL